MDAREQRGLVIAATCRLNHTDGAWLVPSQSTADIYRVSTEKQTCTCPDHQEHGHKCKHIHAVEITMRRELHADGTIVETKTITLTEEKTYSQNWPVYNRAQQVEKDRLQEMLADLCSGVAEPERAKTGRKPHSVRDMIFAIAFKVYCQFSARRFESDLREAHERGHLSREVPGMKTVAFMANPALTPILKELIVRSSLPLRSIETDFAIDSSGFTTSRFVRWYDVKYGVTREKQEWVKAHIACGVKTNVVTAVRILDKDTNDCTQFIPLVNDTAKNFTIGEVSADKAYGSLENFEAVSACGGEAFIAFKSNTTGGVGGMFAKMFHYFLYRQEEFQSHYHKRSNVESTFSMIKRKFGDSIRSREDVAMTNETLCKILCHNLCCLIQAQAELGITTEFWGNEKPTLPAPTVEDFDFSEFEFVG